MTVVYKRTRVQIRTWFRIQYYFCHLLVFFLVNNNYKSMNLFFIITSPWTCKFKHLYQLKTLTPSFWPLTLLKDKFLTDTVSQVEELLIRPPPCRLLFWLEFQKESLQCNEQNDCEYCFLKNLFPHIGQVIIEPTFDFLFWRYIEFLDSISMILLRLNSFLVFPFI